MNLVHFLIMLAVALFLFLGRKIPDALRPFGGGPGNPPPTHALPVSSPIETSSGSGNPDKVSSR
jgi:hypothetical protein